MCLVVTCCLMASHQGSPKLWNGLRQIQGQVNPTASGGWPLEFGSVHPWARVFLGAVPGAHLILIAMRYVFNVPLQQLHCWFYLGYYPTCSFKLVSQSNAWYFDHYIRVLWFEVGFSRLPYQGAFHSLISKSFLLCTLILSSSTSLFFRFRNVSNHSRFARVILTRLVSSQ